MGTKGNAIFIAIASIVLCVAIINIAGSGIGLWTSPSRSSLEGREYQTITGKNIVGNFAKGKLQNKLDQFFADRIPWRDEVLLANAELQRIGIRTAKIPFGYDCYPAFFGATNAVCEKAHALYKQPFKKSRYDKSHWNDIGKALSKAVKNNPSVNSWVLAMPDSSELCLASPLMKLVSKSADYDYVYSKIAGKLPEKINFLDLGSEFGPDGLEAYQKAYYITDHHWNICGGADCYSRVVKALGRTPIDTSNYYLAFDQQMFGSYAREALCDYIWDDVYDIDYEHSNLSILIDGENVDYSKVDVVGTRNGKRFEKKDKFGSIGFHTGNLPLIEYENLDLDESAGSLLLIGDSYTNNNDRLYAETYKHVYSIDPRYYKGSISKLIAEHDIRDVAIVLMHHTLGRKATAKCLSR